jgi:hypothetical protein
MAFSGTQHKRSKTVTGSELIEKVSSSFNFLGLETACFENRHGRKTNKIPIHVCEQLEDV